MALYWEWKDKCGEATFINREGKEYTVNLYKGNAFLIFINEYKETDKDGEVHNMYSLHSFFADEVHAKNCLGLTKGYTNMFNDNCDRLVKLRLNKDKYPYTKKLIAMLVKAFDELTIELYREEGSGNV